MTGRDLIIYILSNGLEDEPVFKDGKFIGSITAGEAAEIMHVGVATIGTLVKMGLLNGVSVGNEIYILTDYKFTETKNRKE